MERVRDWVDLQQANRFIGAAGTVLNAHIYLIPVRVVRPLAATDLVATVRDVLGRVDLEGPLTAAVLEDDPGLAGLIRCPYQPPDNLLGLGVAPMTEAATRRRLEAMLLPRRPYQSPYRRATAPDEAASLVATFLDAFDPRPTLFAEVDPGFLRGWTWIEPPNEPTSFLEGFHDSAMILAEGPLLALLVNNGSD